MGVCSSCGESEAERAARQRQESRDWVTKRMPYILRMLSRVQAAKVDLIRAARNNEDSTVQSVLSLLPERAREIDSVSIMGLAAAHVGAPSGYLVQNNPDGYPVTWCTLLWLTVRQRRQWSPSAAKTMRMLLDARADPNAAAQVRAWLVLSAVAECVRARACRSRNLYPVPGAGAEAHR